MKLSRERKFFVGICGLAIVALVVDRTLLAEHAGADELGDPSALLVPSGGGGARPAGAATTKKPGGDGTSVAAISDLLTQMAERNRRQLEQTPDAFSPGAAWSVPDMSQPAPPAADARVEEFAKRKLTSLVAPSRGKAGAMVDGRMVHVGQSLDGFTLVAVDNQSALFEGRAVQVRLSLAGAPRVTSRATQPATDGSSGASGGTLSGR